jgi:type IV pilus assembly protein PilW
VPPWDGQPMVGLRIVDGSNAATGSPDTLFMLFSGKPSASLFAQPASFQFDVSFFSLPMRVFQNHRRDSDEFVLDERTNVGNVLGDMMVAVPNPNPPTSANQVSPNWCSVFNISADPGTTDNRIVHQPGTAGPWNQDVTNTIFPGAATSDTSYASGSQLINMGAMPYREYSIGTDANGTGLQMRWVDSSTAQWVTADQLFPQIVNLQAVYGRDTVTAAPGPYLAANTWDNTTPTTPEGWARVIAVRIALVARSTQYEKEAVTTAEPSWMPDGVNSQLLKVNHIDNWQHYRYKVFEAVVPLRNMLWKS